MQTSTLINELLSSFDATDVKRYHSAEIQLFAFARSCGSDELSIRDKTQKRSFRCSFNICAKAYALSLCAFMRMLSLNAAENQPSYLPRDVSTVKFPIEFLALSTNFLLPTKVCHNRYGLQNTLFRTMNYNIDAEFDWSLIIRVFLYSATNRARRRYCNS